MRSDEDVWRRFLFELADRAGFESMTLEEREQWILANATERTGEHIGDTPDGPRLTLVRVNNPARANERVNAFSNLQQLDNEAVIAMQTGVEGGARSFTDLFPRTAAQQRNNTRPTLVLLRQWWSLPRVSDDERVIFETAALTGCGSILDMRSGVILSVDGEHMILEEEERKDDGNEEYNVVYIKVTPELCIAANPVLPVDQLDRDERAIREALDMRIPEHALDALGQGGHKSLQQKILRLQPTTMLVPTDNNNILDSPLVEVSSVDVLIDSCLRLIKHHLIFLPQIQRQVGGVEAFCKRLVVVAFEDSWPSDYHDNPDPTDRIMIKLCGAALCARTVNTWRPCIALVQEFVQFALKLLDSPTAAGYARDRAPRQGYGLGDRLPTFRPLQQVSAMVDELKAFPKDLTMIRDIAQTQVRDLVSHPHYERPRALPIWICVDHHFAPSIALFMDQIAVPMNDVPPATPFHPTFATIFGHMTGKNPRRPTRQPLMDELWNRIDLAQRRVWHVMNSLTHKQVLPSLMEDDEEEEDLQSVTVVNVTLELDWVDGMVGDVGIRHGRSNFIATITDTDPELVIAVTYKPSRTTRDHPVSEEDEDSVRALFIERLRSDTGVPITSCSYTPPNAIGKVARLDEEGHMHVVLPGAHIDDDETMWENQRVHEIVLPLHPTPPPRTDVLKHVLQFQGLGVVEDFENQLTTLFNETPLRVLTRLRQLFQTSGVGAILELPKIGREGGANLPGPLPHIIDGMVFYLCARIALIAPGAMRLTNTSAPWKFHVPNPLLLRFIVIELVGSAIARLREQVDVDPDDAYENEWPEELGFDERPMYPFQEEGLQLLQRRYMVDGRTTFGVFASTGSGKTRIVLEFIRWLHTINTSSIGTNILWAVPPGVEVTARAELEIFFGSRRVHRWRLADGGTLRPGAVTIIKHDELRKVVTALEPSMHNTLFVMDEIHKALNPTTQRTAAAQRLSQSAKLTIILSATPVRNNHVYEIATYLNSMVSFPVANNNVLSALSHAFNAQIVVPGVTVQRDEIVRELTNEEKDQMRALCGSGNMQERGLALLHGLYSGPLVTSIVDTVRDKLANGHKCLVVAVNSRQQHALAEALAPVVHEAYIPMIGVDGLSLNLTPTLVANGEVEDYDVVITRIDRSEGYTLTTLDTMITSIYPGSAVSRKQMEGRILRLGQEAETVTYVRLIVGAAMSRLSVDQARGDRFLASVINIGQVCEF